MPRNGHVRFGGRAAETHQPQDWQGAAVRPLHLLWPPVRAGSTCARPRRLLTAACWAGRFKIIFGPTWSTPALTMAVVRRRTRWAVGAAPTVLRGATKW